MPAKGIYIFRSGQWRLKTIIPGPPPAATALVPSLTLAPSLTLVPKG